MNPIALKDLEVNMEFVNLYTVTVKVLKVWIAYDHQNQIPVSLEAVFVDDEGTVIHGSSTKRMLEFFQTKLTEGSTVKISQFDVEENVISKWHRAKIDHPCKLLMNCGSNVVNCRSDQNILTNGIKLVPFGEITSRDPGLFIDIIGQVVSRGDITVVEKQNARKLDIELRDDANVTVKCVLWESYADKLLEVLPESGIAEAGIVIILQFALKFPFQTEMRIQTSSHYTKLYINEDLPEFAEFKIKKKDNGNNPVTYLSSDSRSLSPDEWLNMEMHRTPKQINDSTTVGQFIVYLTFQKVDENAPWFYMSCSNCNGNVRNSVVGDVCNSSKCSGQPIQRLIPKFRVKFIAKGAKEEKLVVVAFEDVLLKFINKTCQQVYDEWKEDDDENMLPIDFFYMLHRDFLAMVCITEYNLKGDKFKEFSLDVMTDDVDTLSRYTSLTIGENEYGVQKKIDTGKRKIIDIPSEDSSNDTESFLTPIKSIKIEKLKSSVSI